MKILVLGAAGLLGNAVFRVFSQSSELETFGSIRNFAARTYFHESLRHRLKKVENLEDIDQQRCLIDSVAPDVIVNCVAPSKDLICDLNKSIATLALLPHSLQFLCRQRNIRLIQISSDGVFSGKVGEYSEDDIPDANDPYGIAKIIGEVDGANAITLRTSVLGPELGTKQGLLGWFLEQREECRCYRQVIFSGFPSVVLAGIIRDFVIPNGALHGIYHVASEPISKFDLLQLVCAQYKKSIRMVPDDSVVSNRSLSACRFRLASGYIPPSWPTMIKTMHDFTFGLREADV